MTARKFTWFLLSMLFLPGFALAQSAELINQVKKEGGEVILYTTMTVGDFQHFNKAAEEKYPFLNIRHVYLSSVAKRRESSRNSAPVGCKPMFWATVQSRCFILNNRV